MKTFPRISIIIPILGASVLLTGGIGLGVFIEKRSHDRSWQGGGMDLVTGPRGEEGKAGEGRLSGGGVGGLRSAEPVDWAEMPLSADGADDLLKVPMTPELARNLLQRIDAEITNISERAKLSSVVLMVLCQEGHSSEAWDLLDENPGAVRNIQLAVLFGNDAGPLDALVSRLEDLAHPAERLQALRALVNARSAELVKMDFDRISINSPQEKLGGHPG